MNQSNMDSMQSGVEIDYGSVFRSLLRGWKIILLAMIVCAAVGTGLGMLRGGAAYSASCKVALDSPSSRASRQYSISENENAYLVIQESGKTDTLGAEFANLLSSKDVQNQVIKALELDTTKSRLFDSLIVERVTNTRYVDVKISNAKKKTAKGVLEKLVEIGAAQLSETYADDNQPTVTVLGVVVEKESGLVRNILIFAVFGALLGMVFVAIRGIVRGTVYTESDARRYVGAPVLSIISNRGK